MVERNQDGDEGQDWTKTRKRYGDDTRRGRARGEARLSQGQTRPNEEEWTRGGDAASTSATLRVSNQLNLAGLDTMCVMRSRMRFRGMRKERCRRCKDRRAEDN